MPWNNQGGPWGSGSGGGGRGPWGSGPQPGGGGGGPVPPDLEELIRRGQEKLKRALPGGPSNPTLAWVVGAVLVLGGLTYASAVRIESEEVGVVLRFGKYVRDLQPGLNFQWPYPIETVLKRQALRVNTINIGMRTVEDARRGATVRDVPEESLMLTGDENIVDVDFTVMWRIKPNGVGDYLFNIQSPEGTVKAVAESAMREVIGRSDIQPVLTGARNTIEIAVQELMQKTLNDYNSGIQVQQVQLQKVDPPTQVIDSFRDVQAARADAERAQNEAQTYANRIVPEARGRASQITQNAEAYREQTVADAKGQSSRFSQVLEEYQKAPAVTRQRLYLETMERVLAGSDKTIIDTHGTGGAGNAQGVVPFLSLNELSRRPAPPAPTPSQPQQSQPSQQGGSR